MSHPLHKSIRTCLLIALGCWISCTCATEQWKWVDDDCAMTVLIPELYRPLRIEYNRFDRATKSNCLGENYEWYTTIQYHSLFFFHLFHIFSYKKKVSVTDISQKFEKKNTSTSSQTTSKCTIPFSTSSSSSSLWYHSFICLILSIYPQKNAVLVFSKQKTKTAEDLHLYSFFFSFLFKTKQNKRCFCTG